jgi:hypothetical protein
MRGWMGSQQSWRAVEFKAMKHEGEECRPGNEIDVHVLVSLSSPPNFHIENC